MNRFWKIILLCILPIILLVVIGIIIYKSCKREGFGKDAIINNIIKVLARQAARWSTASKQDKNSMIAVLHANYGAGYLWALKDIASTEQIKVATGIDLLKFEREIVAIQDNATKKMAQLCPKYAPEPTYLTKLAGEG